jgi:hypothetical protein
MVHFWEGGAVMLCSSNMERQHGNRDAHVSKRGSDSGTHVLESPFSSALSLGSCAPKQGKWGPCVDEGRDT